MTEPTKPEKGLTALKDYLPAGAERVIQIYELGRRSALDAKQIGMGLLLGASSASAFWVWYIYTFFLLPYLLGGP